MKVLFVCSGNAFRSPVAEALLKKLKPEIEVSSAGSNPFVPDAVAGSAKNYLAREGATHFLKHFPEGLDSKQLDDYDLIIAMKLEHKDAILGRYPRCEHRIVVWNIEDPYFLPRGSSEKIFNQIKDKVIELANSL
jgi:protein-tyrosine-phosphatase